MINGKRVVVVMPAYNAEKTLEQTYREVPLDIVDEVILTDDSSKDSTATLAAELGITVYKHQFNRGYGGNQKTCYRNALARGADIVVMLHPDYQYTPLLLTAMISMIAFGVYDVVLASRILGKPREQEACPFTSTSAIASDLRAKFAYWSKVVRVSHWLSRIL